MARITEIRNRERGSYNVYFTNDLGNGDFFSIYAKDELDAYAQAQQRLQEVSVTIRITIICATILLLAAFGLIGYGCSESERMGQKCLDMGKQFAVEERGYSCK